MRPAAPRPGGGWWHRHMPAPRPAGTGPPPTIPGDRTSVLPGTRTAAATTHDPRGADGSARGPRCAAGSHRPRRPPALGTRQGAPGRTGTGCPPPPSHRPASGPPGSAPGGCAADGYKAADWSPLGSEPWRPYRPATPIAVPAPPWAAAGPGSPGPWPAAAGEPAPIHPGPARRIPGLPGCMPRHSP